MSNPEDKGDSTTGTLSRTSTSLDAGFLIEGKYQIIEKVGHGGMGAVYRAKHTLMDREVAVKVLHAHLVENAEFLRRFQHEAQVASKLHHANAVMIYDFGIAGKLPYLVMEFVQGETLKDMIAKEGAISLSKVEMIMSQVFSALVEAHRLGIIHRDLKPDNFILTTRPDGSIFARILDFGIAKLVTPTGDKAQTLATQAGMFFGTPRYASPEQALGKELDARADIYALGVILYEALSGDVPFDAPSMMELLLKHLNQPPPPLRATHPKLGISQKVEDVVLKCLQKDRDHRYQTIQELSVAFKEAVITGNVDIRGGSSAPVWIAGAIGTLLLGSAGYFGYAALSGTSETEQSNNVVAVNEASTVTPTPAASATETVSNAYDLVTATATVVPTISETHTASSEFSSMETSSLTASEVPTPTASPEFTPTASSTTLASQTPTAVPTPTVTTEVVDDTDPIEALKSAEQFYRAKSYTKAIPLYEKALQAAPTNKKSLLNFGICYLRVGRMDDAFKQFKKAFDLDRRYPPTLFNFACYYALSGQKDAALKWLELTIDEEPAARNWARSEPDLASIKNMPKFKDLVY